MPESVTHPDTRYHLPPPRRPTLGTARRLALTCAPGLLAAACALIAILSPEDSTAGYAVGALARAALPLLMLLWPVWAAALWRIRRTSARAAALSLLALPLAGIPPRPAAPLQPDEAVVVVSNVNAYSGEDATLEAFFAAQRADAIITVERRGAQIDGMVRVADNYDQPLPRPSYGSAAFCRDPDPTRCAAELTELIGSETIAMPVVLLRIGGVCVLGLHAPPPYPYDPSGIEPYFTEILSRLDGARLREAWGPCRRGDDAVLAGDLNAVPGSTPHRRLRAAGLHDVRRFVGVYGLTWPTGAGWGPLPLLRLDHVFVGPDSPARLLRTLRVPGADHKALVLAIQRKKK